MVEFDSLPINVNCTVIDNGSMFCQKYKHTPRVLSVLHVNARSIQNRDKFTEFLNFVETFKSIIDVIVVSESWLKPADPVNMYSVTGFSSEFWFRTGRAGGGLVVYIAEELSYTRFDCVNIGNCEEGWLEIVMKNGSPLLLGAIYRPPNCPVREFSEGLEKFAVDINRKRVKCLIVGDINIDLNCNTEYSNLLDSSGLKSLNSLPTRSTYHSETNIDHVYVNCEIRDYSVECGTVETPEFTDHNAVFCMFGKSSADSGSQNSPETNCEKHYALQNINEAQFIQKINNLDFGPVLSNSDPDEAYDKFVNIFMMPCEVYLKTTKKRKNTFKRPWITQGLVNSIAKRDKMYKTLKSQPFNIELKTRHNMYKKLVRKLCRKAEKDYFSYKLHSCKGDSRRTWDTINEAIGRKKTHVTEPNRLLMGDGSVTCDKTDIANCFNEYFSNIGITLSEAFQSNTDEVIYDFKPDSIVERFQNVTEREVSKFIRELDPHKSPGTDDIHPKLLKLAVD